MEYYESVLIIIFTGIGILYALIIWSYTYGWYILKEKEYTGKYDDTFISVIIPARNEEENIAFSLSSLLSLDYPAEKYQLILVDDHSNDQTVAIAEKLREHHKNLHIIKLPDNCIGKKAAISTGISYSKGELIVTTDADCRFSPLWLRNISDHYQAEKPKMILGPVVFEEGTSFFQKIQSLEFLSLIATGAGSVAINTPILCNGANLAYEKKAFDMVEGFKNNQNMVSGDDIFLLFKIRKKFGSKSIKYLKSYDATVKTKPPESIGAFLQQRIRWISKSRAYTNFEIITTSLVVYLFNYSIFMSLILGIWSNDFLKLSLILFIAKLLTDFPIYRGITNFTKKTSLLWYMIPMQFLYVFYVSLMGFFGNFLSFKWKGRKSK